MTTISKASLLIFIALIASVRAGDWCRCNSEPVLTCYMQQFGKNNVSGIVHMKPIWRHYGCHTLITARIKGLKPLTARGWHIHEFGDISKPQNVGPIFSHPLGWPTQHGLRYDANKHWGSLGNLHANANGVAHYRYLSRDIYSTRIILGRAMTIHLQQDQGRKAAATNGNVGGVSAQCVIGLSQ